MKNNISFKRNEVSTKAPSKRNSIQNTTSSVAPQFTSVETKLPLKAKLSAGELPAHLIIIL